MWIDNNNDIAESRKILQGRFVEGERVTVEVDGKTYTRTVKYSNDFGDLYIVIARQGYLYSEFY